LDYRFKLGGSMGKDVAMVPVSHPWSEWLENIRPANGSRLEVVDLSEPLLGASGHDVISVHRKLEQIFLKYLPQDIMDVSFRKTRDQLLAVIATHLVMSSIGLMIIPSELRPHMLSAQEDDEQNVDMTPFGQQSKPHGQEVDWKTLAQAEDDAITRLRQLGAGFGKSVPRKQKDARVLTQWRLGEDPGDYKFITEAANTKAIEEEKRKIERVQARRRARAERYGLDYGGQTGGPSSQPAAKVIPSSQPAARIGQRSQLVPASSQMQPTQPTQSQNIFPSQTMSQPAMGLHGVRPAKKQKKKRGFR
jgi:hypothetical protein